MTQLSSEMTEQLQEVLNRFIEAIAVMIITSCVIPILVLVFFFTMIKLVFGRLFDEGRDRMETGLSRLI